MSFKETADLSHKIWRENDFIPRPQALSKMKAGASPVWYTTQSPSALKITCFTQIPRPYQEDAASILPAFRAINLAPFTHLVLGNISVLTSEKPAPSK